MNIFYFRLDKEYECSKNGCWLHSRRSGWTEEKEEEEERKSEEKVKEIEEKR